MNKDQKKAIIEYIKELDPTHDVIKSIKPNSGYTGGKIEYNDTTILLHREISQLGDEEYVRAYLVTKLIKELGYTSEEQIIEFEKTYSIGRPSIKKARIDILVKYPSDWPDTKKSNNAFLFIECKAPEKYESDKIFLRGQLFDLSKQEVPQPEFGVYYTVSMENGKILDSNLIINFTENPTWDEWDKEGQPSNSILPEKFGIPKNVEYTNTEDPSDTQRPLELMLLG